MRVLVCGSREWTARGPIEREMSLLQGVGRILIHGCARGADEIANATAIKLRWGIEAHEPNWDELGKKAGPIRNSEMAKAGAALVLAFTETLNERSGTLDMIRKALAQGIEVRIYPR